MVKKAEKYFEGVGRRKTSISRARIVQDKKNNEIIINHKPLVDFFPQIELQSTITAPLRATAMEKESRVEIRVQGGGKRGQAEASQMGIARALIKINSEFQRTLRDLDYLKRDPRKKERKKPGLKKARRAPQWAKR